jgi:hypothetical protein
MGHIRGGNFFIFNITMYSIFISKVARFLQLHLLVVFNVHTDVCDYVAVNNNITVSIYLEVFNNILEVYCSNLYNVLLLVVVFCTSKTHQKRPILKNDKKYKSAPPARAVRGYLLLFFFFGLGAWI